MSQPRVAGRLLTVRVHFGAHSARLLVDTGAGLTLITPTAGARLGLRASGTSGRVGSIGKRGGQAALTEISRWSLGGRRLPTVSAFLASSAVVRSVPGIAGALGGDAFAGRGGLTLDYAARTLRLGRPAATPRGRLLHVRIGTAQGARFVVAAVRVGPASGRFLIDTGASTSVMTPAFARRAGVRIGAGRQSAAGGNGRVRARPFTVRGWRAGGVRLPDATGLIASLSLGGEVQGIIGSDVLASFGTLRIDYRRGTVRLG